MYHRPRDCLKSIMFVLELSEEDVKKIFNIKHYTYLDWITGTDKPDKDSLLKLIELMKISDKVMSGEIVKTKDVDINTREINVTNI